MEVQRMEELKRKWEEGLKMAEYNLLDKNEIKIYPITLSSANLTDVAACVADVIGIDRSDVLVIDVRDGSLDLDVLRSHVDPMQFVGKKEELLQKLAKLPGVEIYDTTDITSRGMLGWIALDDGSDGQQMREALLRSQAMESEIIEKIARRVIVFSSGFEVESGQIEDTNTPTLIKRLEDEGFKVTKGPTLKDDEILFAGKLREAVNQGYGTIITTGGVGAEDKDCSVEAVLRLDHNACTPYIAKFEIGTGRHHKDGIRIAVGKMDASTLITLPGPNDEVKACLDILVRGLKSGANKETLANELAERLRNRLREKMGHHKHHHQ